MRPTSQVFREQLESLHAISIEITRVHELPQVLDRSLGYCLDLTGSQFGFVGLLSGSSEMNVATIKGFEPLDPAFCERFRRIPIRPSVFGVVLKEGRPTICNDFLHHPGRVSQPPGHPPVRTFLGVPLEVGGEVIGMIGVANKHAGYTPDDQRLLTTFANQAAVAIENARLYEVQREMIERLEELHQELDQTERERVRLEERERIALEIHDQIEQGIFTIGLALNSILEKDRLPAATRRQIQELRGLAARAAEEVKEVIFALSIPGPEAGELPDSLRRLLKQVGRRHDLETDLVVSGAPGRLTAQVEKVLYDVAEEALINVVRHAHARMVLIGLHHSSDCVELVIQDDGVGAPDLLLQHYGESATHFGLRAMKRSVEEVGGTFGVANGEQNGLSIRARVPI